MAYVAAMETTRLRVIPEPEPCRMLDIHLSQLTTELDTYEQNHLRQVCELPRAPRAHEVRRWLIRLVQSKWATDRATQQVVKELARLVAEQQRTLSQFRPVALR